MDVMVSSCRVKAAQKVALCSEASRMVEKLSHARVLASWIVQLSRDRVALIIAMRLVRSAVSSIKYEAEVWEATGSTCEVSI